MDNFQDEINKAQELRKANILNSFSNADVLTKAMVAGQTKMINGKLHVWKQLPSGKFDWRKAPVASADTHTDKKVAPKVTANDFSVGDKIIYNFNGKKIKGEILDHFGDGLMVKLESLIHYPSGSKAANPMGYNTDININSFELSDGENNPWGSIDLLEKRFKQQPKKDEVVAPKKDVDATPKKVDAEPEDKEEVIEDDTKLPHIASYLRGKKQGTTIEITRDAKNKIYNEAGNESSYLNSGDTIKKLPGGIYLMYGGDTRDTFGPIDPDDKTLNALTNDDFKEVDPNAKKLTPVGRMKEGSHYMLEGKEHEYVRYDRGKKHPYILRDVKTNQLTAAGPKWMASKYPDGIEEVTKTASKNTYAEHIEKFAEHIKGAAKSHSYLHISYNEKADVVYVSSKNGNVITRANNQNKKYGFDKTQLKDLGDKLRDMGYSIAIHK